MARARVLLYTVTTAAALGEAAGLRAVGMVSTVPLAAQASALLPLMAFHDDRWLFVYATSWPVLAVELGGAIVVRSCLASVCVAAAWPSRRRPAFVPLLGRVALAYALLLAVMSPWALLSFVTAVTSVSYPLIGAVAAVGLLAVFVLPHAGVARWWWAHWPGWRAMAWGALDVAAVTAAAIGIGYSPGWVALAPAAAAGLVNGWCWEHVVRACAPRRAETPGTLRRVAVPASVAAVVVGLVVVAASAVTYVGKAFPISQRLQAALPRHGQHAVVLVDGYQSRWHGGAPEERFGGFFTIQYSYRGLSSSGRPLPYASVATTQSLGTLSRHLGAEVDELERLTGHRVDIVAVSEGTYIVREYLATHPHPPLGVVVLGSPLPRPDRVFLPALGHAGYGVAAAWEMNGILDLARDEEPTLDIGVDMPMVRSLLAHGPLFRQRSLCPAPGVRVVALLPLSAALDDPPGPVGGVSAGVVPAVHATLVERGPIRRAVARVLAGHRLGGYVGWGVGFQLLRYAASAAETPSLALDAVPAWRHHGGTRWGDAAFGTYGCPALDHPSPRAPPRGHR